MLGEYLSLSGYGLIKFGCKSRVHQDLKKGEASFYHLKYSLWLI